MSVDIAVAIIGGLAIVTNTAIGILIPVLIKRISNRVHAVQSDVAETKEHVVNDHGDRPMRDENDTRYATQMDHLEKMDAKLDRIGDKVESHDGLISLLFDGYIVNRKDLDDLENTLNPND